MFVLASIPNYLMSVIKFPKCAISLINSQMAHCLWDDYEEHHKSLLETRPLTTSSTKYLAASITWQIEGW
jgi:hypothetical protein